MKCTYRNFMLLKMCACSEEKFRKRMDYIVKRSKTSEVEVKAGFYTVERMKTELKFSK